MNIAEFALIFFVSVGGDIQVVTFPEVFRTPMKCESVAKQVIPSIINGAEAESRDRSATGSGYRVNVTHSCTPFGGNQGQPVKSQ